MNVANLTMGSSIDNVNKTEIVDIFVDYEGYENENFNTRLQLLRRKNGWVHYAGGLAIEIKKSKVSGFRFSNKYLGKLVKLKVKDIISKLGKPDIELYDDISFGVDFIITSEIMGYPSSNLFIFIDPENKRIKEIVVGKINEKYFTKK